MRFIWITHDIIQPYLVLLRLFIYFYSTSIKLISGGLHWTFVFLWYPVDSSVITSLQNDAAADIQIVAFYPISLTTHFGDIGSESCKSSSSWRNSALELRLIKSSSVFIP